MLRWLFSLALGPILVACHVASQAPTTARATPPPVASSTPRVEPVSATACRAEPSTVYGEEPVVFRIEAPRPTNVEVTLTDELGRTALRAIAAAPGTFQPTAVPSGDFTLQAGTTNVLCVVTVNRELARASQPSR